jgi:hypothetical protein
MHKVIMDAVEPEGVEPEDKRYGKARAQSIDSAFGLVVVLCLFTIRE